TNKNLNFTHDDDDDFNVFGASIIDYDSETNDLDPHTAWTPYGKIAYLPTNIHKKKLLSKDERSTILRNEPCNNISKAIENSLKNAKALLLDSLSYINKARRDNAIKSISPEYNTPNANEKAILVTTQGQFILASIPFQPVVDVETTGSTIKISTDREINNESNKDVLFLSTTAAHPPASVDTISGWLKNILIFAEPDAKAKDIRAISANFAYDASASVDTLLIFRNWSSNEVYKRFYQRGMKKTLMKSHLPTKILDQAKRI
ncbi:10347_t:CDS:2, partial [Racocetra persica]